MDDANNYTNVQTHTHKSTERVLVQDEVLQSQQEGAVERHAGMRGSD